MGGIVHRIVVLAGIVLAGVAPPTGARPLFTIRGIDDDVVSTVDSASSRGVNSEGWHPLLLGRHLTGTGDLLKQMHRMRHQDHKDEGLNLTRSMLAGRASRMNNRTKARLIKLKKNAAPPKASVKPKKAKAPTAAPLDGAAPGPDGAVELVDEDDGDDFWTDDDFDDFNEDDYLEDLLKECAKDKAIAIFSCDAKYGEMCKLAVSNLEAMGIGHLAIASDEDVCDTLGYDDYCCTVAEDVLGGVDVNPEDGPSPESMSTVRWQYLEIALGFNYDVILQDCDVLWTKNPVEDFRSDPEVGIIGLRERGTDYPFNAGLTWFRSDRAAVTRLVRDVNERVDFFTGVKDEPFRLEEIGIGEKCKEGDEYKKLYLDQSVYDDALESSALNDDVYTRSRQFCDKDGRDTKFNCIKNFPETGCLMLEPDFGSGDGFANFKERNGKIIKCGTDPDADINDAPDAAAASDADAKGTADAAPAAEKSSSDDSSSSADADTTPAAADTEAATGTAEKETSSSTAEEADSSTAEEETTKSEAPQGDSADAAAESSDDSSSSESTPATEESSSSSDESSSSASDSESTERRHSRRALHHRRRLLANPRKLRQFQVHRRAVLQSEDEAAPTTSSGDGEAAAASEAAPSADEEAVDFSEKPAKACVAADDVLASWLWSEDKAGKEGAWSMKNPVALAYHFDGADAPGGADGAQASVADKVAMMKKVLEA